MNHSPLNMALQTTWRFQVLPRPNHFTFEAFRTVVFKAWRDVSQIRDQDFVAVLTDLILMVRRTQSFSTHDLEGIDQQMDRLQEASRRASDARAGDHGPAVIYLSGYGKRAEFVAEGLGSMGIKVLTMDPNASLGFASDLEGRIPRTGLLLVGNGVLDDPAGVDALTVLATHHDSDLLVILATDVDLTFEQRMQATAFGPVTLFGPEADLKVLRSLVRSRAKDSQLNGFKVLLLDDSRTDGYRACMYMREEGLEVKQIQHPREVLDAIEEFRPDLVVTDFHMPGANGDQVASIIRQDREATMPIIFLSSEDDAETQLMALAKGADGFVQKPVQRGAFIKALKSLISRSKSYETRMRRDPLTGLLNHGQFMASAGRVTAKGGAQASSIVMIDIDHFKLVNDTYGHQVGDKVLVALAEILSDSLRSTDYVGRLGGEEFAVVMAGADLDAAKVVIDRLRDLFSSVRFNSEPGESSVPDNAFSCTFSAGIAILDGKISDSIKAADEAMYLAKHNGRDQVVIAGR
ncbi:diguanylate cyclase [Pseudomonas sp. NPDC089569]|uniref:GGDEF domain-containing protein n=1 Tax=Pseudomonas sp. NPDC089569 TaxID=3390722 RepID=UPI003D01131A